MLKCIELDISTYVLLSVISISGNWKETGIA